MLTKCYDVVLTSRVSERTATSMKTTASNNVNVYLLTTIVVSTLLAISVVLIVLLLAVRKCQTTPSAGLTFRSSSVKLQYYVT